MKLSDLLSNSRIATGVTVTSKKRALEELSRLLALGAPALAAQDILGSLAGREKLGSTGLGHGVAIPHGRVPGVEGTVGAFIRLRHPVEYEAHDSKPVDLIFGLLVPQQATGEHLRHLAAIAERFSDDAFCEALRGARDEQAALALLSA